MQEERKWHLTACPSLGFCPSLENGLTLCVGSFAASSANDVLAIAENHADKINYVHLRNIATYNSDGSFAESGHLRGDVDMVEAVRICLKEQRRRIAAGENGGRLKREWPHQCLFY